MTFTAVSEGPGLFSVWHCLICHREEIGVAVQDYAQLRTDAVEHVVATGHSVSLMKGTGERLHGRPVHAERPNRD
jgi:hypothetical protein